MVKAPVSDLQRGDLVEVRFLVSRTSETQATDLEFLLNNVTRFVRYD